MRAGWYIKPATAEWVRKVSSIGGMSASEFVERLVRYHACDLEEPEHEMFNKLLDVAADVVALEEGWDTDGEVEQL